MPNQTVMFLIMPPKLPIPCLTIIRLISRKSTGPGSFKANIVKQMECDSPDQYDFLLMPMDECPHGRDKHRRSTTLTVAAVNEARWELKGPLGSGAYPGCEAAMKAARQMTRNWRQQTD